MNGQWGAYPIENSHSHVIISDDHGETWRVGAAELSLNTSNECSVAELANGRWSNTRRCVALPLFGVRSINEERFNFNGLERLKSSRNATRVHHTECSVVGESVLPSVPCSNVVNSYYYAVPSVNSFLSILATACLLAFISMCFNEYDADDWDNAVLRRYARHECEKLRWPE